LLAKIEETIKNTPKASVTINDQTPQNVETWKR
jgi:hypothetical protein